MTNGYAKFLPKFKLGQYVYFKQALNNFNHQPRKFMIVRRIYDEDSTGTKFFYELSSVEKLVREEELVDQSPPYEPMPNEWYEEMEHRIKGEQEKDISTNWKSMKDIVGPALAEERAQKNDSDENQPLLRWKYNPRSRGDDVEKWSATSNLIMPDETLKWHVSKMPGGYFTVTATTPLRILAKSYGVEISSCLGKRTWVLGEAQLWCEDLERELINKQESWQASQVENKTEPVLKWKKVTPRYWEAISSIYSSDGSPQQWCVMNSDTPSSWLAISMGHVNSYLDGPLYRWFGSAEGGKAWCEQQELKLLKKTEKKE